MTTPIDMLLFCPLCHEQHIDQPDVVARAGAMHRRTCKDQGCDGGVNCAGLNPWTNPSHKSHLCAHCGCIWRPADVPTNGVKAIATSGAHDTWRMTRHAPAEPGRCICQRIQGGFQIMPRCPVHGVV